MVEKVYTIKDLGPGDGGKGGVVHKVSEMMSAHFEVTVVKEGGAQGSHGVCTSAGERHAFSQWGCGTFEGIKTHLSSRMVVSPAGLLNEANVLRYQCGIHDPFSLLTVDETALCATSYHGIASRIKELARGKDPRGTVGTGVGEAYRDSFRFPDLIIRAGELSQVGLKEKLAAVRAKVQENLAEVIRQEFLLEDRKALEREIWLLNDDGFLDHNVERFREVAERAKIVGHDYLGQEILAKDGVVVVESSHGVLTDNLYGFYPHVSALRTLPCFTDQMFREAGYEGQIVRIGVTRAYQIRHGAGPMPTDDKSMAETLLPGSNKKENRYQGRVRVGALDFVLLKYVIEVCGGPKAFDGLAVTWFDQIQINGSWKICKQYRPVDKTFFAPDGTIKVWRGESTEQRKYQENLGARLKSCVPEFSTIELPSSAGRDKLYSLCSDVLESGLGVPVRLVSFGPSERDKFCK